MNGDPSPPSAHPRRPRARRRLAVPPVRRSSQFIFHSFIATSHRAPPPVRIHERRGRRQGDTNQDGFAQASVQGTRDVRRRSQDGPGKSGAHEIRRERRSRGFETTGEVAFARASRRAFGFLCSFARGRWIDADVDAQENVLEESEMMVKDNATRVHDAYDSLAATTEHFEGDAEVTMSEEYKLALELMAEVEEASGK